MTLGNFPLFATFVVWCCISLCGKADAQLPADLRAAMNRAGDALIVGIWAYDDKRWSGLPSIRSNISELSSGLEPHFERVQVLPNPTAEQLRRTLRDFLIGRARQGTKRLFVFYGGHGFTDFNQATRSQDGYITGRDTPAYTPNDASAVSNAVSFHEIDAMNRESSALQVFMAFDSCFSGSIFQTRSIPPEPTRYDYARLREAINLPSRYYVTAGGASEQVPAESPFSELLLKGLSGDADFFGEGFITGEQLAMYLKKYVPNYSRTTLSPQSGAILDARLSRGQFAFAVLRPGQTRVVPGGADRFSYAPPPPPPQTVLPNPAYAWTYLVFFDWDKATLTDRAKAIIAAAAAGINGRQFDRIEVNGYDDTSHSPEYSQGLSLRRAQAVAAELVRNGVSRTSVRIQAFGSSELLVPTSAGVREPQNRRVEIIIR